MAHLPDGRAVFVPGTCPGDEVTIEVTAEHERWARGTVLSLDQPSADRVEPACPYFGVCGGCQWQHISYDRQLAAKATSLTENLKRIGQLDEPAVSPPLASPAIYGYRNRIELSAAAGPRGTVFGFTRAGDTRIVPIETCHLLPERARRLPKALSGALRFVASRGALDIQRATLRVSAGGEISVDLWTAPGPFPRAAVARVVAESTRARTVTRVVFRGTIDKRDISQVEVLSGPGAWSETLGGDRYLVSAPSFFQVNTAAAAQLRKLAVDLLAADGSMRVADLYAGAGTFTLPIARLAGETVAIEGSRWALGDLRRNLEHAELDADVVPGDAAHALGDLGHCDAALIDPPRSGISESAMRALIGARIQRLVYVSCDPATLARDVQRLTAAGYNATRFVPIDLFPQTYHLETVALLELG